MWRRPTAKASARLASWHGSIVPPSASQARAIRARRCASGCMRLSRPGSAMAIGVYMSCLSAVSANGTDLRL
jgi:hypothetical protein